MSCRGITARSLIDAGHGSDFHRSVRFSSECRSSTRQKKFDSDEKETGFTIQRRDSMSQSAPTASLAFQLQDGDITPPPAASCRFPKLEDCAHFHYERVSLGGLSIECVCVPSEEMGVQCAVDEGWVCLRVRSHVTGADSASANCEWTLTRNKEHFLQLDDMLHRCIYDRQVSGLPNLAAELPALDTAAYNRLIADYVHHLSMIADDTINCGPALNWLQMDNKGHKLLVCGEDSNSINTPAVAAAYSVRPYVSQARDELSFDVGDMISVIDMPGPNESLWWRGKRGFRVGFFPHNCVAVIGDKVPRNMTQPLPIVGSVAMAPIKPVLRKHGKLISLFRSFILSRPSRRSLKQQGILRERVFGCDLGEHLLNCGHEVPQVLVECARFIEERGAVDGVYRLSGGAGLTQRLRAAFDEGAAPDLAAPNVSDPHAPASLLKMYFRELPNPLCTYQLYESFVAAVGAGGGSSNPDGLSERLQAVKEVVRKLPPPHYRTLAYLMRHLRRVSLLGAETGMTARNMAIVWAPNLLRAPRPHHALQGVAVQAVVTEFLIVYAEELFGAGPPSPLPARAPPPPPAPAPARRPKSLPLHPPATLLTLDEARRRSPAPVAALSPPAPVPSGAIAKAASSSLTQHNASAKPKYIEVGSGPDNLPRYHTVLELPAGRKTRAEGGWRGLFSRKGPLPGVHHVHGAPGARGPPGVAAPPASVTPSPLPLREVRSFESLSDSDSASLPPALPPAPPPPPPASHSRCRSCDSYFEPWQAELAGMRLRLAPQERSTHMFSEEERPTPSPPVSPHSPPRAPPSPARAPLEDILPNLTYIDGDSPRIKAAEKRERSPPPAPSDQKRLCRHPAPPPPHAHSPTARQTTNRHSLTLTPPHSTLIRVDWPSRTPSENSIQKPNISSDCENKKSTEMNNCIDCGDTKCLKCELAATDYENVKFESDIAYKTLNRLSVLSSSTDSSRKNEKVNLMTSSHESSSSYSRHSDDYEHYDFRPNYTNLQSSSTSKSSPGSPLKSPLKSTISITYRSPTKMKKIDRGDDTPTAERDSIYEDVVLEKHLAIVEDASIPDMDASLPTPAQQPDADVYSQVKFFKKSIDEVNAMILESPESERHYENVTFGKDYEDISVDTLKICEKDLMTKNHENGNVVVKNQNVKRLAIKFESPTEPKEPFIFEKFKAEIKYPSLERKDDAKRETKHQKPPKLPKTPDFSKSNAKSLDENAFFKEFGETNHRRNSLEVKDATSTFLPDLNLNMTEESTKYVDVITPPSENKVSFIQRFEVKPDLKNIFTPDTEKKMSRERIEKYKEERRNFLREKYSSQSFRSSPEQLTRIKIKKDQEQINIDSCDRLKESPKFERRNTVDLGHRLRFSLTKSANDLDDLPLSPTHRSEQTSGGRETKDKLSPSYNIKDMKAIFEQKSQLGNMG